VKTFNYTEDARLTLEELSEWALTPADELLQLERRGVIERGPDGLFPILSTTNQITDHIEAEIAYWRPFVGKGWGHGKRPN
jgi:hypothetical protein